MNTTPKTSQQAGEGWGQINWMGMWTLIRRENMRYLAIWQQTIFAPLITAALFLLIFSVAVGPGRADVMGHAYLAFLAPGLIMMTVIQNAFANTSSSLLSAKVMGNIVDTLMPPLSPLELTVGYIAGGVGRAIAIAGSLGLCAALFLGLTIPDPIVFASFVLLGACFMAGLGVLCGIYAIKFDQMAAITNFIVTPLAFLSGTFYSVFSLPEVLQKLVWFNPLFYIIDGGRSGVLEASDSPIGLGLAVVGSSAALVTVAVWWCFLKGYRLKP